MKKVFCAIFLISMMIILPACNSLSENQSGQTKENDGEIVAGTRRDSADEAANDNKDEIEFAGSFSGGWELVDNKAAVLPAEVQTAFDKAVEKYTGSQLKPVAYLARQIVAGNNYMILCQSLPAVTDPDSVYQMVVIYADLEGNASITHVENLNLADYNK